MEGERLSTNAKLALLINGPEGELNGSERRLIQANAIAKLRRATLYGSGARAKVPKVKQAKLNESSPFTVMEGHPMPSASTALASAVPPGAHMDQFRLVTNPTQMSLNDPDRVFLNSSSMKDGLVVIPGGQPPWYYGNNNKTKPADSNFATMAASRYGFKGAQQIRQKHIEPYERPSATRTEHTPAWLETDEDLADEWVPPIVHTKFNTVNGMESPKLWPENTEYPSGYMHKRAPTSTRYRRETTVDNAERPRTSQAMSNILNRTAERSMLSDYTRMEKSRTFSSLPITAQDTFAANWADRVAKDANSTLRVTMNRETPAYEAHSLSDATDVMRYSGTTAMIVNSQSSEEVKFRSRLERSKQIVPYDLRWKKVITLFRAIKARLKREQSMSEVLRDIAIQLHMDATKLGASTVLKRVDFVGAIAKIPFFESFDMKLFSAVYGVFDPLKKNIVRYVELIKCLAVLDNFDNTNEEKLLALWDVNMEFGQDMSPFDIAMTCLTCICGCDADAAEVKELFKVQFRPACYKMSILEENTPTMPQEGEEEGLASTPILKKNQVMSAMPAFNIIDNFLTRYTFVQVVRACPLMYALFDRLLDERLNQCFGSSRQKIDAGKNDAGGAGDKTDFAWILKKKKIRIGSKKGPTIARRPSIKVDDDD